MNTYTRLASLGHHVALLLLVTAWGGGTPVPTFAQQVTDTAVLEEITVTSRKFEERLQEVPLSISAYTADALERQNIVQIADLGPRVPSLSYEEFGMGLPRYYIRGIGSAERGGASDPAVGIFTDEVYVGRASGTSGDFLDIERVEILRGPQGTLFGRNVVGGAISMHSKRPTPDFHWSALARGGNNGRADVEGMLSGPLSDTVSGRIAAAQRTYEGHSYNTLTGHHLDDQDRVAARGSLLIEPNESVEVLLRAEYGRDDARGQWWHLAAEGPFSQGNANPDPRRGRNPDDGYNRREDLGFSATVNWDAAGGTFTSISAYRDSQSDWRENSTGLVVLPLTDPNRFNEHHTLFIQTHQQEAMQYSQEFRFAAEVNERFGFVTGMYYFDEQVERAPTIEYRFTRFNSEGTVGWDTESETESFAAFGQARYWVTPRVQLTAGGRWTQDRKSTSVATFGNHFSRFRDQGAFVSGWSVDEGGDWSELTPTASVSFYPERNIHLFATVSRGFKSGGFSENTGPERATYATPLNPEFAWAYEVGIKSELLQRRLRLNTSLFFVDYTDLQVLKIVQPDANFPPIFQVGNAGKAEVKGAEVEWEVAATDSLSIYGSYAYNDNEVQGIELNGRDISGNRLAHTPESKYSLGAAYTLETAAGSWTLRADYSYEDDYFNEIGNSDVTHVDSHDLIDASLNWRSASKRLEIELWGKNLSDELYWTTASEVPVRDAYVKFGAPRTYGVTFSYQY